MANPDSTKGFINENGWVGCNDGDEVLSTLPFQIGKFLIEGKT